MGNRIDILAYRLTASKYAERLDGAGAASCKRNRWNQYGQFVTYAASSRALAMLEMRVHSAVGPPKDAVIAVIGIAMEETRTHRITAAELPEGWRSPYEVGHCQIRGSQWYTEQEDRRVLVVPSAVVPAECIYVIRGNITEAVVLRIEPLEFDPRLWEVEQVDRGRVYTLVPGSGN